MDSSFIYVCVYPYCWSVDYLSIQQYSTSGLELMSRTEIIRLEIRQYTMQRVFLVLLMVSSNGFSSNGIGVNGMERPNVVNIGSLLTFDSAIGKVAKVAIEAAVQDVNRDEAVLGATKLNLAMQDTNYSGFLVMVEALSFMDGETVAIIGPQSSVSAHVISHIANDIQVPLLSFGATDPTLSSLQYPFFVRTTQNDLFQMTAIAEIIYYCGWRDVTAIYVDDDHGRNGIAALEDKLAERRCRISYKAPLSPRVSRDDITDVLVKVNLMESRILVLLAYPEWGMEVFDVAQYFGMTGTGYEWIVTDWLTTFSDTNYPLPSEAMDSIQGALTLRMYTPDSQKKRNFVSGWSKLTREKVANGSFGLSTYGLYAYDTVWLLAYAIDSFFNQGGNISFSSDSRLTELRRGNLKVDAMSIFNGGDLLLDSILQVNLTVLTGPIKFTSDKNLIHPAYEVINVIGNRFRRIGYWSNHSGLSVVPPELLYTKPPIRSASTQNLHSIIWPGLTAVKRAWVFPNNGRYLRIGVPNWGFSREFVALKDNNTFSGYCIDVFTAALNLLPYAVPYKLYPYGNVHNNPRTSDLLQLIAAGVYDAAIGDITINNNRSRVVDFTQPYTESGLVIVAPVKKLNSNALAFLRPFTPTMWFVTGMFFLIMGVVVWMLEHRINDDFRGPPKRQIATILWFSFSTLFFAHEQNTISTLGRFVLIIWLFVVLILNSSYTAILTSILTVEQLSSPIKGIESLASSDDPIGYHRGSFAESYLANEYNIDNSRLVPLISAEEYAKALKDGPKKGGVAAVVDERTYVELFLSTQCEFRVVGPEFSKSGWGFAFPRDSPLAVDLSAAILKLSESGDLQRIHDKWLQRSAACSSEGAKIEADRLHLKSFVGLFVMCGIASLLALLLFLIRIVWKFYKRHSPDLDPSSRRSPTARFQSFISFVAEKEQEVKSRPKRRRMEKSSNRNLDGNESGSGSLTSTHSGIEV